MTAGRRLWLGLAIGTLTVATGNALGQERDQHTSRLSTLVGHGEHTTHDGEPVFLLDSRKWDPKQAPAGVFPLAVLKGGSEIANGTLRARFKLIAGETDQTAGLVFNLKPSGDYHFVRYNTREGNAALWSFSNGERQVVAKGDAEATLPLDVWHDLMVMIDGPRVTGTVNGMLRVQHTLDAPVGGQVGLWTKRDSVTAFKEFSVDTRK